ncbi:DUF2178 domain-containing protein [Halorientalis pallida]|uniref:DUF2178 domain-containing protein n=1 Tax=Halorientalis pallida TaxID=2479928 RepID=A0A498KYR0_9EURY|nr:DUF2178 domain-containing protein [Halorientalis pallida]RXK48326.1 DUF2178 domain-containing protein [Halorientalis pallida]
MSTTQEHPARRGQRYNRIIMAVFAVGIVSFFAGMLLDQTLAGLVVYAVACLGGIAALLYLQFASSVQLTDEREQRLNERASGATIMIAAYIGLPVVIGLYLLDNLGYYTIPPVVWGGIYAYSALFLLWGVVYTVVRYNA